MRRGLRNAINRLLGIGIFAVLFTVGVAVAVEAGAALTGFGSQLDPPIHYSEWWDDLSGFDPSQFRQAVLAGLLIVAGLALLVFELWPRRRDRRTTVAETDSGKVELRLRSVQPYLEDRLRTLDWVRRPGVHVKRRKSTVRISAKPLASRLAAEDDIARARELLESSVSEIGLTAKSVAVEPQVDKKTMRVQ